MTTSSAESKEVQPEDENKSGESNVRHDRLLYFYRMFRMDKAEEQDAPLTPDRVVAALNAVAPENRFYLLPRTRNKLSYVYANRTSDGIERFILTTCRRFWSKVQEGAKLRDLRLAGEAELAETAHLCIFPDGFMGIEFNQTGPKLSQFEALVNERCGHTLGVVGFLRCMRRTTEEAVKKNQDFKKIKMRVWKSEIGKVPQNLRDNLIGAMDAMDVDNIEIVIRNPRNEKSGWKDNAMNLITSLVGYKPHDKIRRPELKADAIDEHGIDYAFNLLNSQISMRRTITFDDNEESRYIDSSKWFETIVSEKEAQQQVLEKAIYGKIGEDNED